MKRPSPTIVLILCFALIFAAALYFTCSPEVNQPVKPQRTVAGPVETGFRPANKHRLNFDVIKQIGTVGFEVQEDTSTVNNGSLQDVTYRVVYYNFSKVTPATISDPRMNVGCIAAQNVTFQQDNSIFAYGAYGKPTGTTVSLARSVTVAPYDTTTSTFTVNGLCQYIGTQDGEYWWDMTKVQ